MKLQTLCVLITVFNLAAFKAWEKARSDEVYGKRLASLKRSDIETNIRPMSIRVCYELGLVIRLKNHEVFL